MLQLFCRSYRCSSLEFSCQVRTVTIDVITTRPDVAAFCLSELQRRLLARRPDVTTPEWFTGKSHQSLRAVEAPTRFEDPMDGMFRRGLLVRPQDVEPSNSSMAGLGASGVHRRDIVVRIRSTYQ